MRNKECDRWKLIIFKKAIAYFSFPMEGLGERKQGFLIGAFKNNSQEHEAETEKLYFQHAAGSTMQSTKGNEGQGKEEEPLERHGGF